MPSILSELDKVFIKYMQLIIQSEGVSYLRHNISGVKFTDVEKNTLKFYEKEAMKDPETASRSVDNIEGAID